jgi:hypothetical protein
VILGLLHDGYSLSPGFCRGPPPESFSTSSGILRTAWYCSPTLALQRSELK